MFVNPYSGKKRAPKIYKDKVLPLLELADISVHTIGKYTTVGSLKMKTLPWSLRFKSSRVNNTCGFQQCGILTSVDSDEPVLPPVKLRNSK